MPQDRKILSSMVPSVLRRFASSRSVPHKPGQADEATLSIPARLARAGLGARLIVEGGQSAEPDPTLIKLVLKTEALRTTLMTGGVASIEEIAKRQGVTSSYVTRCSALPSSLPTSPPPFCMAATRRSSPAPRSCAIRASHWIESTSAAHSASSDVLEPDSRRIGARIISTIFAIARTSVRAWAITSSSEVVLQNAATETRARSTRVLPECGVSRDEAR